MRSPPRTTSFPKSTVVTYLNRGGPTRMTGGGQLLARPRHVDAPARRTTAATHCSASTGSGISVNDPEK